MLGWVRKYSKLRKQEDQLLWIEFLMYSSPRFEQFPVLLAYVKDTNEVAPLIECAKSVGVKAVPRNGGHRYYSSFRLYHPYDTRHKRSCDP